MFRHGIGLRQGSMAVALANENEPRTLQGYLYAPLTAVGADADETKSGVNL